MTSTARYYSNQWGCDLINIPPGACQVTAEPVVLTAILGSCISACIHDPIEQIGGMNHFMLPDQNPEDPKSLSMRYGLYAMEQLINAMMKLGSERDNLVLKICGGGDMMHGKTDIGAQNISFIRRFLSTDGLTLSAEDLGGFQPRRVAFFPTTGKLFINKLKHQADDQLIQQEQRYKESVRQHFSSGDITLFNRES